VVATDERVSAARLPARHDYSNGDAHGRCGAIGRKRERVVSLFETKVCVVAQQ